MSRLKERNKAQPAPSPLPSLQIRKMPGEAMQTSTKPQPRASKWNARILSGFLTVVLGLAIGGFTFLPHFRITVPVITGSEQVNLQEVTYYTRLQNKPIYSVDPEWVQATLLKRFPETRGINVQIELPNHVSIEILKRIPMAEWDFGGDKFWVDKDGRVIKEATETTDMIYVLANSYPGAKTKTDRKAPNHFTKGMMQSLLAMYHAKPAEKTLYYTFEDGYGWDTEQGFRLWLGQNDIDLQEKLAMADSLTTYFKENEIEPDMLSLEFARAPYYRYSE